MPFSERTVEELNWYFDKRRNLPLGHSPMPADSRFEHAALAFDGPRFDCLYRRWLRVGAGALKGATTRLVGEALTNGFRSRGMCRAESHVRPPLTGDRQSQTRTGRVPDRGRQPANRSLDLRRLRTANLLSSDRHQSASPPWSQLCGSRARAENEGREGGTGRGTGPLTVSAPSTRRVRRDPDRPRHCV